MRIEKTTESYVYHSYPCIQDLMDQPIEPENRGLAEQYSTGMGFCPTWFGVDRCEDVQRAVQDGWPAGLAKMREAVGSLELPKMPSIRRKKRRGDFGDELDIHRVNRGDLSRAWTRTQREQSLSTTKGHVTIVVDVTVGGGVEADMAMWRGAAAVAIAEAALKSGRHVRAVVVWSSTGPFDDSSLEYYGSVVVKHYHQRMSAEKLMTVCALPGFYRLYGFRGYMSVDGLKCNSYLGSVTAFKRALLEDGSSAVWIPHTTLDATKAAREAKHAVKAMVNRIAA